ncbi:enoyl-CoA hydratase/isomerase family protein [Leekyejoonella antrihumi]|uniref:3-hydroxyisobutyryl-CoA hydrolase n=1 Tax=Leekyejoonella antrihumi TaxID=1660198 RepID=A0A563E7G6_9MICO|nr:enoyl-CoA hydratase/isomerase family protein [Leekyejoonella antrihumi]TWP38151.1 enoyl-CoA hydratase/isomerase family protein [Leekyejoonella antrihumi]
MSTTEQVRCQAQGPLRRIILNRPHAINALTTAMVEAVEAMLKEWAGDDAVTGVTIEGAGDKGLCAGGDVVAVRRGVLEGGDFRRFFRSEYAMNSLIDSFPKPLAVFQDGLVLGGGVGVSAHAGLRVVTARTRMAMPETNIGFFPDVGALFLLSRAPGETKQHGAHP